MKEKYLRFLYRRFRTFFYGFFVEEFLGDVPKDLKEPAMTFLSEGKERLERWALFQAHVLQTRIVRDPELIREYQGMMLMLKLLLVHVEAPKRNNAPPPNVSESVDHSKDVDTALKGLRELSTPKN